MAAYCWVYDSRVLFCSLAVLDPRVGHNMDVLSPFVSVLCHSDWLFHGVLSTSWCCPSRPCVAFLACVHLALFLALSLSPGNFLVSSWCEHSMLPSLLWRRLTVPSLLQRTDRFKPICIISRHIQQTIYTWGDSDVTESMVTKLLPFCGYSMT